MSRLSRWRLAGGATAIRAAGVPAWALRRYGWFPTIVTYHGVHDGSIPADHARYSTKHVDVRDFRRQLVWLQRHYSLVPLAEVEATVRAESPRKRLAAVTFDDGYENNLTVAWPVLRELRIPATFFVTANVVEQQRPYDHDRVELALRCTSRTCLALTSNGRREEYALDSPDARGRAIYDVKAWLATLSGDAAQALRRQLRDQCWDDRYLVENRVAYQPLTWQQVRRLADDGAEIGSHTLTHPHLAQTIDEDVRRELADSRRILEERTAGPVTRLSYPHGNYDARVARLAAEAGYTSAYTSQHWFGGARPDLFAMPRISVNAGAPFGLFVVAVTRALRMLGRARVAATAEE